MIKAFGYFLMFVFLVLCTQLGGFSPGFSIWFLSALLVVSGSLALIFLQFPKELEAGTFQHLLSFSKRDLNQTVKELELLSNTIRRDGLLAVEGMRRELKDPFLRHLIKRVLGGFEKNFLITLIHHQYHRTQELFSIAQNYSERVIQALPIVGLIGSLMQIMDFLNHGQGSVGVAFIPFVLSLFLQIGLQSYMSERLIRSLDLARLYFILLEDGLGGIQEAISPELLQEKLRARLHERMKWSES